jgi:SAM-dependent methyltransferase
MPVLYAVTIFLSAFLLFQVQPLIGKYILPWYGGGAAIWTTCLLFFQAVLLAGYAYAHAIGGGSWRRRRWLHIGLLLLSIAFLPIVPEASSWPEAWPPTVRILLVLGLTIGVPFLMLSSTGPLVQAWYARRFEGRSPYRLYALSNAGSLLALLSYPVVIESMLARDAQAVSWSWGYGAFALLSAVCAWKAGEARTGDSLRSSSVAPETSGTGPTTTGATDRERSEQSVPGPTRIAAWLALSAAGSALLLATTNQLCQEIAVFPFLWVLPLALYLLTFIICFEHERWYDRRVFGTLLFIALGVATYALYDYFKASMWLQIAMYSFMLFACCMGCHGELVRLKPHPRHLTLFYLAVAAGGVLGGVFVALIAPLVFRGYWELHVALAAAAALVLACTMVEAHRDQWSPGWRSLQRVMVVGWVGFVVALAANVHSMIANTLARSRSFYGVLRVIDWDQDDIRTTRLYHGMTLHGLQFTERERHDEPTTYYGPDSAVGLVLGPEGRPPRRVGVVGLGVGTLAAYGREGDVFRFYEINADVVRLAQEHFTYLQDTKAEIEIVLGDARQQLEHDDLTSVEPLDILVVDAFNSDAIPVHLITTECIELYWRRLRPDGVLLLHISNRFIDLLPVMREVIHEFGLTAAFVTSAKDVERQHSQASWVMLAREGAGLAIVESRRVQDMSWNWTPDGRRVRWTDDFSSLWPVVHFEE